MKRVESSVMMQPEQNAFRLNRFLPVPLCFDA